MTSSLPTASISIQITSSLPRAIGIRVRILHLVYLVFSISVSIVPRVIGRIGTRRFDLTKRMRLDVPNPIWTKTLRRVSIMAPGKRKASVSVLPLQTKKPRAAPSNTSQYKDSTDEIKYGIVLRKFYPPEMLDDRARDYISGKIERPIETLQKAIEQTLSQRDAIVTAGSVVHWFKCDTRLMDNHALHLASTKAREGGVPLICLYLISPQDFEAHLTAPIRVDFILRNLAVVRDDLAKLDIPLFVETVQKRRALPSRLLELCNEWNAKHVFCNAEYEVDELRREASLTVESLKQGIAFNVVHDTCVVEPGKLTSGSGGQFSVYSPWHRRWCAHLNEHSHELDPHPMPQANPPSTRKQFPQLFSCKIPDAPESKRLSDEEQVKFQRMWPAGEHEALERLQKFLRERVVQYHNTRNLPSGNGTSVLSPHLAAGTLAARTVVRAAREAAPHKKLTDDRKQGHSMWIGEVAWRDFYTHVLCHWPYIWYSDTPCDKLRAS